MNGLNLAERLREALGQEVPVVILTGDISAGTVRQVTDIGYVRLDKPGNHQESGRVCPRPGRFGAVESSVPDA